MPLQKRIDAEREFFEHCPSVMVATEAAGEGINLQFCSLMVNYDIPWNPNRLEQRMGRIHRYGQKASQVVILNLVAPKTREGLVLQTLLEKLERIRKELRSDKVFDVIGRLFDVPLMARLVVGPSWAMLSPAQQQQIVEALAHYISATYADRVDSYSGQQLQVTGEELFGADITVKTRIVKSNGEAVSLDYRMRENAGAWQICDVYIDGSSSQLATERSEFHSILQRQGVNALITALNRKVDLLTRTVSKA